MSNNLYADVLEFCEEYRTRFDLMERFGAYSPIEVGFALGVLYQKGELAITKGMVTKYIKCHPNDRDFLEKLIVPG